MVTKILEHYGFYLEEEKSINNSTRIERHALWKIWIPIIEGVVVMNPSKVIGVAQSQQALEKQGTFYGGI